MTISSGVIELDLSHEDIEPPKQPGLPSTPVLTGGLELLQGNDPVAVMVRLRRPEALPVFIQVEAKIAEGKIRDSVALEAETVALTAAYSTQIKALKQDSEEFAEQLGANITYSCTAMPCFAAEVPADALGELAAHPDVVRISPIVKAADESQNIALAQGTQADIFLASGWNGRAGSMYGNIPVAVIEAGMWNDEHRVFWNNSGGTPRFLSRYQCTNGVCSAIGNFSSYTDHATTVMQLILGDLTQAQHPAYPGANTASQQNRSGFARESWLHALRAGNSSDYAAAVDTVLGLGHSRPRVVNMSQGYGSWNHNGTCSPAPLGTDYCNGDNADSMAANDLYLAGLLLIKSAGNDGTVCGPDECRVTVPGSAIGTFTVGMHNPAVGSGAPSTTQTVRTWAINSSSARGGTTTNLAWGKGRTVVDLTAFGRVVGAAGGGGDPGAFTYSQTGTSFAAPVVTGAAAIFIHHFQETFSTIVTDPGMLYANLLLMGDRQGVTGKMNARFSRDYGAGRLKMRKFDPFGMDSPYGYGTYSVCVGQGSVISFPLNGGVALPAAVDDLKVVAYWYDPRHELGHYVANVDLRIRNLNTNTVVRTSADSYDNKGRAYYSLAGGKRLSIEVVGTNINPTQFYQTCSALGQVRVNVAWFYEDDARDDLFGPWYDSMTYIGVEPE